MDWGKTEGGEDDEYQQEPWPVADSLREVAILRQVERIRPGKLYAAGQNGLGSQADENPG